MWAYNRKREWEWHRAFRKEVVVDDGWLAIKDMLILPGL